MGKEQYTFNDFLTAADAEHHVFFTQIDKYMTRNGYTAKVELKKTGYVVSYVNTKTKRALANYVTRKKGIFIRIYSDNADEYLDVFDTLPKSMIDEMKKARLCKRFIDPDACNPRCKMGLSVRIDGEVYKKCRFSAMQFFIEQEKYQFIREILENEIKYSS